MSPAVKALAILFSVGFMVFVAYFLGALIGRRVEEQTRSHDYYDREIYDLLERHGRDWRDAR